MSMVNGDEQSHHMIVVLYYTLIARICSIRDSNTKNFVRLQKRGNDAHPRVDERRRKTHAVITLHPQRTDDGMREWVVLCTLHASLESSERQMVPFLCSIHDYTLPMVPARSHLLTR